MSMRTRLAPDHEVHFSRSGRQPTGTSEPLPPEYVGKVTTRGNSTGALDRMARQKT